MSERYLPLLATVAAFVALFSVGGFLYDHFMSTLAPGDVFAGNAFIITAATGATVVILSGGVALSIGSMIGFVGGVFASLDVIGWRASAALTPPSPASFCCAAAVS